MKTITIQNPNNLLPTVSFNDLKKYKANQLKDNSNRDVGDLKKAILSDGFNIPMFIWEKGKYICDGVGRLKALELLEYEGYEIPDIPYFPIQAKNISEAKKHTLAISSQYGLITSESIGSFIHDMGEMDLSFIKIPGWDMEEIDWAPPLTKEIDIEKVKGKTIFTHQCPKCKFEF